MAKTGFQGLGHLTNPDIEKGASSYPNLKMPSGTQNIGGSSYEGRGKDDPRGPSTPTQDKPVTDPAADKPVTAPKATPVAPPKAAPVAKPAATPAPAAKPAAAPAPGSFKAAYTKAREMGGSKAQFEFGGKKYQAAATKAEYVPMSQQKKVDIGSSSTGSTVTDTSKPSEPVKTTSGPEFPKTKSSAVPTPPARPQMGPPASDAAPAPKPAPVAPSGVDTPNVSTPSAKPTAMSPEVGRQSAPTDSGSSISVKPEPSSTVPTPKEPEKKKDNGIAVESKLNECVQVGNYKYRIV